MTRAGIGLAGRGGGRSAASLAARNASRIAGPTLPWNGSDPVTVAVWLALTCKKTLGLVGIGNVGSVVARCAVGIGMTVIAFDPFVGADKASAMGVRLTDLDAVIRTSDFISIHSPRTEKTKGMFNAECFAKMKKGVFLVNCARGGIVVEKDLRTALDSGIVRGAGVDVFDKEPPEDWSLARHPKVIASPHIGASTAEAQVNVSVMIARQIGAYLTRGEVVNAVTA